MKKALLYTITAFLALFFQNGFAQQFYLQDWKTITSMTNVTSADMDSRGRVWAISPGGVFIYNREDSTIKEMRNIEGMLSNSLSAVKYHAASKEMYIGTSDGYLEIIDENYNIKHITDIKLAGFANPVINNIEFVGDNAYISGGFGLTIFDTKNLVFLETIAKMGSFQRNSAVNKTVINDNYIWAATVEGVARASLDSVLQDPVSWTNFYSHDFGGNSGTSTETAVLDIIFANSTIYAGTLHHVYSFDYGGAFLEVTSTSMADWENFSNFAFYKNQVLYADEFYIKNLNNDVLDMKHPAYFDGGATNINSFRVCNYNGKEILIGCYKDNGIVIKDENSEINIVPNTPATNNFSEVTVDNNGNLWSATGSGSGCKGLMMFDGTKWNTFDVKYYPSIKANDCYKVYAGADNTIFASTWGVGLVLFKPSSINSKSYTVNRYDESNSLFKGEALYPGYVIPAGVATDSKGNNWVVNYSETGQGPLLVEMAPNGDMMNAYENPNGAGIRKYRSLAIDMSNTKWVGSVGSNGLLYYNEEKHRYGTLTVNSYPNLLDDSQSSLAVDKNGILWICSTGGLSALLNPSAVLGSSTPILRKVSLVSNQVTNVVYVDALNNKWIGTNNGIIVLNPDATEILATINKDNSSLVSNEIVSITSNKKTGEIYIASKGGLNSVQSLSINPNDSYDISCYPQPFNPDKNDDLIIEGLGADTELKILTSAGEYVANIKSSGRRAVWNGRDSKGNIVSNGIYIIVASSETNDNTGTGKIAVIRK